MARKKFFDIFPPRLTSHFQREKPFSKKASLVGRDRGKLVGRKRVLIFLFLFFAFLGIVGYFVLASVKIEIWPKTETLNFEKKITASTENSQIDVSKGIIPAKIFETEKITSQEFFSSGKVKKEASGTIRVYNKYHLRVTLRAGTRFQPPLEKVLYFCSTTKIVIPAKGYTDIKVKACRIPKDRGYEEYNIGPSKFSVPGLRGTDLFFYVHGESFKSMEGGGVSSKVTKEDLERAKDVLTKKLFKNLDESLESTLQSEAIRLDKPSTDFVLLEKASKKEVLDFISMPEVGAEVSSFKPQVKGRAKVLVFKRSDLKDFAKGFILSNIPSEKKLKNESLKIEFEPESIELDSGILVLNLKFSATIFSDINSALLKENLKGKSLQDSKIILENQEGIIKAQISAWPFWLRRIPRDTKKIKLRIRVD